MTRRERPRTGVSVEARAAAAVIPRTVRVSFACYAGEVALAVLVAVLELVFNLSDWRVVIGAAIEAAVFLGLGSQMLAGRAWGRTTLMAFSWVFIALDAMAVIALRTALGKGVDALVLFATAGVTGKLLLIVAGMVSMYRAGARLYFR